MVCWLRLLCNVMEARTGSNYLRINKIDIRSWRQFRDITINVPHGSPIVCVVGENGAGKTQILELIAGAAHQIGLSVGYESSRAAPFSEEANFEISFNIDVELLRPTLEPNFLASLDTIAHLGESPEFVYRRDGTNNALYVIDVDGNPDPAAANTLIQIIRHSKGTHYLMLDADRSYPKLPVNLQELGNAFGTDWVASRKQKSHTRTKSMYEEWFKYLAGVEGQNISEFARKTRLAREAGEGDPVFVDVFDGYRRSVKEVLPHLTFTGVDTSKKEITFQANGVPLDFCQLSGGEKEIAFLIGQFQRFGLETGILLLDEPELHLNSDLMRTWVRYLASTVQAGQIWMATHSLDIVEAVGAESTFILGRSEADGLVRDCFPMAEVPIVSKLSQFLGTPAFSVDQRAYLYIEGQEELGEADRFYSISRASEEYRFLECGSCFEVERNVETSRRIALEADIPLRLAGIVDGDFRTEDERARLLSEGVYSLQVHEVENFFLEPTTVRVILQRTGSEEKDYSELLKGASDRRAWNWIYAATRSNRRLSEMKGKPDGLGKTLAGIEYPVVDGENSINQLALMHEFADQKTAEEFRRLLGVYLAAYGRVREESDLWKKVEGKQVFHSLLGEFGFTSQKNAERAFCLLWHEQPELVPAELNDLRDFIASI